MIITTKYITDLGFIKCLHYRLSHNIERQDHINILNSIVNKINQNVLVLRGHSDYGRLIFDNTRLITDQYSIHLKTNNMNIITLQEPAFGSAYECLKINIQHMAQIECNKTSGYFDSIRIKLIPIDLIVDSSPLLLNEIRSNGIYTHQYNIKFTFDNDWSDSCETCQTGMTYLRGEITKFTNELYISETSVVVEGKIISDLSVNNINVLTDEIGVLLKNALINARVSKFILTEDNREPLNEKIEVEGNYPGPEITT